MLQRSPSAKIVHSFSAFSTVHFIFDNTFPNSTERGCQHPWTSPSPLPIMKINHLGEQQKSALRTQAYPQFAPDRLPDEGKSAPERAQNAGSLGRDEHL